MEVQAGHGSPMPSLGRPPTGGEAAGRRAPTAGRAKTGQPQAPRPKADHVRATEGRAMISRFFIDRPIFATVLSIVITLIGGIALLSPAGRAVPADHAAGRVDLDQLSRGQRPGGGRHRGRPDRAAGQRRAGHALHVSQMGNDGTLHADRHLRHRHRPEHGPGHGAEPRRAGHAAAADRRCRTRGSRSARGRPTC